MEPHANPQTVNTKKAQRLSSRVRIEVENQAELDRVLEDGLDPRIDLWLVGNRSFYLKGVSAFACDDVEVTADGSCLLVAMDFANVTAGGDVQVRASGEATVRARENAKVRARESARVYASGSSEINAAGSARVYFSGQATGVVRELATGMWLEESSGVLATNDEAESSYASDQARVDVESGSLEAMAYCTISALPGSKVTALQGSTIHDFGGEITERGGAVHRKEDEA